MIKLTFLSRKTLLDTYKSEINNQFIVPNREAKSIIWLEYYEKENRTNNTNTSWAVQEGVSRWHRRQTWAG